MTTNEELIMTRSSDYDLYHFHCNPKCGRFRPTGSLSRVMWEKIPSILDDALKGRCSGLFPNKTLCLVRLWEIEWIQFRPELTCLYTTGAFNGQINKPLDVIVQGFCQEGEEQRAS